MQGRTCKSMVAQYYQKWKRCNKVEAGGCKQVAYFKLQVAYRPTSSAVEAGDLTPKELMRPQIGENTILRDRSTQPADTIAHTTCKKVLKKKIGHHTPLANTRKMHSEQSAALPPMSDEKPFSTFYMRMLPLLLHVKSSWWSKQICLVRYCIG